MADGIYLSNDRVQSLNGDLFEQNARQTLGDVWEQQASAAMPDMVRQAQQDEQQRQAAIDAANQQQRNVVADQFETAAPSMAAQHLASLNADVAPSPPSGTIDSGPSNAAVEAPSVSGLDAGAAPATPPPPAQPAPFAPVTAPLPNPPSATQQPIAIQPATQTTVGLSGGYSDPRLTGPALQTLGLIGQIAQKYVGDAGAKAAQAVGLTEGALVPREDRKDIGDNAQSFGWAQLFRGGQLPNFAADMGMPPDQAGEFARQHPDVVAEWALSPTGTNGWQRNGYLGNAIRAGQQAGLQGADLATYAQHHGQVSVSPERAGQNFNALFGGGQSVIQGAVGAVQGAAQQLAGYVFPVQGYSGDVALHWGDVPGGSDLFAPRGTPVVAMHGGKVVEAGYNTVGGNSVLIQGDDGNQYYYAHFDQPPSVKVGQSVSEGTYLGPVGNTGDAKNTGTHLHIGIGPSILLGADKYGGTGGNFDAVGLLRRVLSGQGAQQATGPAAGPDAMAVPGTVPGQPSQPQPQTVMQFIQQYQATQGRMPTDEELGNFELSHPPQQQAAAQPQPSQSQSLWDRLGSGISDVFKNVFGGGSSSTPPAPEGGGYGAVPPGGVNPLPDIFAGIGQAAQTGQQNLAARGIQLDQPGSQTLPGVQHSLADAGIQLDQPGSPTLPVTPLTSENFPSILDPNHPANVYTDLAQKYAAPSDPLNLHVRDRMTPEDQTKWDSLAAQVGGVEMPTLPGGDLAPKAGNINLAKYPTEVQDVIQAAAPTIPESATRGVVPDAVVRDLAAMSGTSVPDIVANWRPGQAQNAETLYALRDALANQGRSVLDAQQALRSNPGSADAQAALVQALTEHRAVQEVVQGTTAEAGRALRQFTQPVEGNIAALQQLQDLAAKTGQSSADLAQRLATMDLSDPVHMGDIAKALNPPRLPPGGDVGPSGPTPGQMHLFENAPVDMRMEPPSTGNFAMPQTPADAGPSLARTRMAIEQRQGLGANPNATGVPAEFSIGGEHVMPGFESTFPGIQRELRPETAGNFETPNVSTPAQTPEQADYLRRALTLKALRDGTPLPDIPYQGPTATNLRGAPPFSGPQPGQLDLGLNAAEIHPRIQELFGGAPEYRQIAQQGLDDLVQSGANPTQIGRYFAGLERNAGVNQPELSVGGIGANDWFRALRNGAMAGGLSTLGHVFLNIPLQTVASVPREALASAFRGAPEQIPASLIGLFKGYSAGWEAASQQLRYGLSGAEAATGDLASVTPALRATNRVSETAYNALQGLVSTHGVAQTFMENVGFIQKLTQQAWTMAKNEGLSGSAFTNRVEQIVKNAAIDPQYSDMLVTAQQYGQRMALRGAQGTLGRGARGIAQAGPLGNLLVPFEGIAYNVVTRGIELTPAGPLGTGLDVARKTVGLGPYAAGASKAGAAAVAPVSERLANNVLGLGLLAYGLDLATHGRVVGHGPDDPTERRAWMDQGGQPDSFVVDGQPNASGQIVGGRYISGHLFGQFFYPFATAAAITESQRAAQGKGDQNMPDVMADSVRRLGEYVSNETWLRSVAQITDALKTEGGAAQKLETLAANMAESFVPQTALFRNVEQATDPYARQAAKGDLAGRLATAYPGLAGTQPVRQSLTGEPVANPNQGVGIFAPTGRGAPDPVIQLFGNAGIGVPPPPTHVRVTSKYEMDLQPDEQRQYQDIRGQALRELTQEFVNEPDFASLPIEKQRTYLQKAMTKADDMARKQFLDQMPDAQIEQRVQAYQGTKTPRPFAYVGSP